MSGATPRGPARQRRRVRACAGLATVPASQKATSARGFRSPAHGARWRSNQRFVLPFSEKLNLRLIEDRIFE